jgi:hypothetical protein
MGNGLRHPIVIFASDFALGKAGDINISCLGYAANYPYCIVLFTILCLSVAFFMLLLKNDRVSSEYFPIYVSEIPIIFYFLNKLKEL